MGQLAELLHRVLQLAAELVEDELGLLGIGVGELAGQPHVHRQRDEVLLGPVVQVALDLAPGLVGRGDDAGARGLQLARLAPHLVERGLQRGVELHVVQGEPDLTGELGEHAVVLGVEVLGPRRRGAPRSGPRSSPELVMGATRRMGSSPCGSSAGSQTSTHAGPDTPARATTGSSDAFSETRAAPSSGTETVRSRSPLDPVHTSAAWSASVLRRDSTIWSSSSSSGTARERRLPNVRSTSSGAWRSP